MIKNIDYKLLGTSIKDTFSIKRNIKELTEFNSKEYLLMFFMVGASLLSFLSGNDYSMVGWLGLITSVATAMSLILVDKGKLTNFTWGLLGSLAWLVVAMHNRLIGDITSQIFYVIMQFVGMYIWFRSIDNSSSDSVESKKISLKSAIWTAIGLVALYVINIKISTTLNGNLIYLDATLLPLGIIGQVLMTYGYRSQWVVWIGLDLINVVIWYLRLRDGGASAVSMFVLQIIMTINAIYGAYVWYKNENGVSNNE